MHNIENEADDIRHLIVQNLSIEFITPIDQEDNFTSSPNY